MDPEIIISKKTGEHHIVRHQGCQDHCSVRHTGGAVILAVSDGHSSCCRSGMGSRIAVHAFHAAAASGCDPEALPGAVKDTYDRLVSKDLLRRPLTEGESASLNGKAPAAAYGATLLGAVLSKERTLLFQLGDGWLTALRPDGTLYPAMEKDADCFLEFTSSLCYPRDRAISHSRVAVYDGPCAALILATDGYAWRGETPLPLLNLLGEAAPLSETVPEVLAQGSNGDDQTAVILREIGIADSEGFRSGLAALVEAGLREKRMRPLLREKEELQAYLSCAMVTVNKLRSRGDPGLTDFLRKVRVRAERYDEVCSALNALRAE